MRRLLIGLLTIPLLVGGTPTTTAVSMGHAYDLPTIARVEVHEFDDAPASTARLDDVRKDSASPSPSARGTSTTSPHPFMATEAAPTLRARNVSSGVTCLPGSFRERTLQSASDRAPQPLEIHAQPGARWPTPTLVGSGSAASPFPRRTTPWTHDVIRVCR